MKRYAKKIFSKDFWTAEFKALTYVTTIYFSCSRSVAIVPGSPSVTGYCAVNVYRTSEVLLTPMV